MTIKGVRDTAASQTGSYGVSTFPKPIFKHTSGTWEPYRMLARITEERELQRAVTFSSATPALVGTFSLLGYRDGKIALSFELQRNSAQAQEEVAQQYGVMPFCHGFYMTEPSIDPRKVQELFDKIVERNMITPHDECFVRTKIFIPQDTLFANLR